MSVAELYGHAMYLRLRDILPTRAKTATGSILEERLVKQVKRCPGCASRAISTSDQGWACRSCFSSVQLDCKDEEPVLSGV